MPYIDETDLVCVKLPADVCPTSSADSPRYLAIIFEQEAPPRAFGSGMNFQPKYAVISRTCMERATLTVDGSLRVKGKRIEPEDYLRRWRAALESAIAVEQLHQRCGLRPLAQFFFKPTADLLARRARWIHPPFETLGALLDLHKPNVHQVYQVLGTDRVSSMHIDLAARHGARDAWWLEDWLEAKPEDSILRLSAQRHDPIACINRDATPVGSDSPLAAVELASSQQGVAA